MKPILKSFLIFLLCNVITLSALGDSGDVKFVNQSNDTFSIHDTNSQKSAQLIGLPISIQSNSDQNYHVSLSDSHVGEHYQYTNTSGNLHFSIDVKSTQNFIYHHALKQSVDYLSVNWENILQHSSIHYVLPLFWNDNNGSVDQAVRVDSDNNAVIGIFSSEPTNVLTIMSYNTDKDGSGTDHNPQYNNINDILNLFLQTHLPTPDILMIQEGLGKKDLSFYQQTLSKLVPGKWYGYSATEGSRSDSNIILISPKYDANHLQFGTLIFKNQCGWGLVGKRNAVFVDIPMKDILQTSILGNLRIFDTHLESGSGSDIFLHAAQVRLAQFNEIIHYPSTSVVSTIIGGDFNTMPIFDDITGLTHYQLGDFISVFDKYLGDPTVNWGQPITCTWSTCAQYTFHLGIWLDRMFVNALSVPGYKAYVLYPFVDHQVDGYSDHLPVWFTVYYDKI